MHKMTNLEYSFIIKELTPLLIGKHLRRIRKLDEGIYRFKIGEHEVLCQSGVRIHITRRIEASEQIDKFADKAGKELDNARLLGIKQINSDRIVSFDFDKGSLIFEMFGEGNAILVHDGKIICAQRYEEWSDRKIKVGEEYKPPKPSVAEFSGIKELVQSEKYVIVLLMKLPFGKEYCLEALMRAGIEEKTPGNKLTAQQVTKLEKEIKSIVADAKPTLFYDKKTSTGVSKINDFSLAKLSIYRALEAREVQTLSEAADEYYSSYEKPNPQREKVLKRIEKQEERKKELVEEEKSYKEKGDFIYSHYQEVEAALNLAKEGKFEELEKKKKAKVDKKEKSIELEIGE